MTRPTRIKPGGVGVFANDAQLDRVQAFGSSHRVDPEELKEVGNVYIVETVDGVPTVDITLDTNEYASVKTIATLANKQRDYGWVFVKPNASTGTSVTVDSGEYFMNEMLYSLTAAADVALSTDILALTATQKQIVVLSVKPSGSSSSITKTLGTAFTTDTVAAATTNTPVTPAGELKVAEIQIENGQTTITQDYIRITHDLVSVVEKDFETAYVDFSVPVKETGDSTTADAITRTQYVENAYVNRYDFNYTADGVATENFSLETDNKRWFLNTCSNIVCDRFVTTAGANQAYTLTQTPVKAYTTYTTCLYVGVYDTVTDTWTELTETTDYTVSGTTLTLIADRGAGKIAKARYTAAAGGRFFKILPKTKENYPYPAGGLKGGQLEIYLSDDASNKVQRIQGINGSLELTRDALYEIGAKKSYGRPLQLPVPVTLNIETTASDLEDFARLCGKTFATVKELSSSDFLKNLDVTIKLYRDDDVKRAKLPVNSRKPLKTITINNISITEDGGEVRVDSNMTQTYAARADNLTWASYI